MRRKLRWLFAAAFVGLLAWAGIVAFLRDIPVDTDLALRNLALGVACAGLTVFFLRKFLQSGSPRKSKDLIYTPLTPVAAGSPKERSRRAPEPPHNGAQFEIHTERLDPDAEIKTPAGADLSYLDAKALKFWNGKTTIYEIPTYYANDAFGRNAGPALGRLLAGGYLQLSDIHDSIRLKTVPELKAVLSSKGLKVSGKKEELVQRLVDNCSDEELRELFPVGLYKITDKGERALEPYSIVLDYEGFQFHFSHFRLMDARARYPDEEDAAIISRLFMEDIQNCYKTGDKETYQRILPRAAEFASANGKDQLALDMNILAFFVWTREIERLHLGRPEGQSYYMARNLENYARTCGMTFPQLEKELNEVVSTTNPFGLGSKQNIAYAVSVLKKSLGLVL